MRNQYKREFARQLRRSMTDAEHRLWRFLRNRSLVGCKFRRQHPIGAYIADFACVEHGLVVELDGSQHAEAVRDDASRTGVLAAHGYRVLRFWNNDVLSRTDAVLDAILAAIAEAAPSPQPLYRKRERG